MKFKHLVFFLFSPFGLWSQNPEGFEKMAKRMEGDAVPVISREQLKKDIQSKKTLVILDAREKNEYEVSHLPDARFVGYKDFDIAKLKDINKNTPIVVYCSVGYRSGKIGEDLKEAGFTKVYNLHGGIFDWANHQLPLETKEGKKTTEVHGYNSKWAEYLNKEVAKPVLK
jgi:rhodanese-related sulfurtransferase